jgi:hypothetical protein
MSKFAIAGAVLALGFAAAAAPASAGPSEDCVDCPVSNKYDSAEVVEKIRNLNQPLANEAPIDVRGSRRAHDAGRVTQTKRAASSRNADCGDSAPRRTYDTQEVVKKVRNIDHSRVINTQTVVPARTRVKEASHLLVRRNETRHVGVVQHNHTIVEKEIRYVRRIPVQTRVEFITHDYRVVERPASVTVPVRPRTIGKCSNRGGLLGTYGSCGPLRVRG